MKQFLDSKETYDNVVETLKQYVDLEKIEATDFIAGGSISNILISMAHGGKPVINDIDVYRRVKEEVKKETSSGVFDECKPVSSEWYPTTFITEDGLEIIDDQYGRIFLSESGSRMRVLNHSRKGIINNINYLYQEFNQKNYNKKSEHYVIIEGFDLNCCKAGLDLLNKKIVYTPEFVDYLETKQLKVTNPCSPIQTSIRLFKKISDLNCYCDVKHEMRFLTVASKRFNNRNITKIIGPETKAKYDKFKNKIEDYFILREAKGEDFGQKLKAGIKIPKNLWSYDEVLDFDILERFHSMSQLKRIWDLLFSYRKKGEQDKINKIFYKNVLLNKTSDEDTWEHKIWLKENEYEIKPVYNSTRFTYEMLMAKKNYHKCNFTIRHVDYIDNFCREHYAIRKILKNTNTLEETYKVIRYIKSLTKKEGDWFIGSLESLKWSTYKTVFNGELSFDFIKKIFNKEKEIGSKELIKTVDLSNFKYKNNVKELVTAITLREEGKKMGHCVGGYSGQIESGASRIFHIEIDGVGSTAEIGIPMNSGWRDNKRKNIVEVYQPQSFTDKCVVIFEDGVVETLPKINFVFKTRQHSGCYPEKGNLQPKEKNVKIVNELVSYLNTYCLPKNHRIKNENPFYIPKFI